MGYNIAIDGPASAGKSTIAKLVAKNKGFIYVDTGSMYRALSFYFIQNKIGFDDIESMKKSCSEANVEIVYMNGVQRVLLNSDDVTEYLRDESVGNGASQIAALSFVREHLLKLQRDLAEQHNVVMDGRDIGTNILPNADVKIYLTASVEARAKRRYNELVEKQIDCNLEEISNDIQKRDERDMNRTIAPLKQAIDAKLIDSSNMTIDEVVNCILEECK